jgi:hypothetical protein
MCCVTCKGKQPRAALPCCSGVGEQMRHRLRTPRPRPLPRGRLILKSLLVSEHCGWSTQRPTGHALPAWQNMPRYCPAQGMPQAYQVVPHQMHHRVTLPGAA